MAAASYPPGSHLDRLHPPPSASSAQLCSVTNFSHQTSDSPQQAYLALDPLPGGHLTSFDSCLYGPRGSSQQVERPALCLCLTCGLPIFRDENDGRSVFSSVFCPDCYSVFTSKDVRGSDQGSDVADGQGETSHADQLEFLSNLSARFHHEPNNVPTIVKNGTN